YYADAVVGMDAERHPTSHYGVFKVANEQAARVYWETWGLASTGLRPHSAYGPGRDQGVTSKPTVAMIAAAAGRPYGIDFGGGCQFQFVEDVASAFVAAARGDRPGAEVFSIGGPRIGVDEIVEVIGEVVPESRGRITSGDRILPFPEAFDGGPLEAALGPQPVTPLGEGVRRTIETYRWAMQRGLVDDAFLDRVVGA
ncbi:MAG TPA: SDR family oxidoreductase, partial [Candidatus Limnocylindrales bacterium]